MPDFRQTMSSLEHVLEGYEGPDVFFLHNINADKPEGLGQSLDAIAASNDWKILVEPDGVEPTTSCLQSRRSTN